MRCFSLKQIMGSGECPIVGDEVFDLNRDILERKDVPEIDLLCEILPIETKCDAGNVRSDR